MQILVFAEERNFKVRFFVMHSYILRTAAFVLNSYSLYTLYALHKSRSLVANVLLYFTSLMQQMRAMFKDPEISIASW